MPIEFRCPTCTRLLRVPDSAAGRQAKCPACEQVTTVPESSSAVSEGAPVAGAAFPPRASETDGSLPSGGPPAGASVFPAGSAPAPMPPPVGIPQEPERAGMECKNHPGVYAINRCTGCAEPFCGNCLVFIHEQPYCASCKVMAIQGPPPVEVRSLPCKEASEALTYAIVGLFCCGIILEPIAIAKALDAKKKIAMNPRLTGAGRAQAALVIAIIALILWGLGMLARVAEMSRM